MDLARQRLPGAEPPRSRFAGPASSCSTPATASAAKKPSARLKSLPSPAGWPPRSPTKSIIRSKPSPTCSSSCATTASSRTRRSTTSPWPSTKSAASPRSRSRRSASIANPRCPARTKMTDLLDSVLSLYQGRFNALNLQVERDYDPELDLFCFAGEIRQVFANLVGNSIDASSSGGRLLVRARRSRNWKNPLADRRPLHPGRHRGGHGAGGCSSAPSRPSSPPRKSPEPASASGSARRSSPNITASIHVRSRAAAPGKSSGTVFQFFIPDDPSRAAACRAGKPDSAA